MSISLVSKRGGIGGAINTQNEDPELKLLIEKLNNPAYAHCAEFLKEMIDNRKKLVDPNVSLVMEYLPTLIENKIDVNISTDNIDFQLKN
jgi:hypothetical protein